MSDYWHRTVIEFPLPIIAAVNGPAQAGGLDLAVTCDIRIAAAAARFAHPEQSFSDMVFGPLHDLCGGAVARDLCFTGPLDRCRALRLSVVSAVVPEGGALAAPLETAAPIGRGPR